MKYILFLFLISFSLSIQAQDDELDKVFDDGGISQIKNSVNISASDLVEGFLTVGYDRYVGRRSALGLSFGIYLYPGPALHWYLSEDYISALDEIDYDRGFMFQFRYRTYYNDHDGFFWQYGFMFKKRQLINTSYNFFSFPESKLGYKFSFLNHFSIAASAGIGFGFHILKDSSKSASIIDISDISWYIPINIEMSYDF